MSSRETARQHRDLARDQYKRGKYMEVMHSADKALALGYLDISVYDIKAAALGKLIEPEDGPWRALGLETIKVMCHKWPKHWRPWYRRAEHLLSRSSYNLALTAIGKSLELVDTPNRQTVERKRTEIQGLREVHLIEQEKKLSTASKEEKEVLVNQRRIEANRTKDFTHLLSPDILHMIVDHLLVDNPGIACRIGAVRRSWRDWMLERPGVWQNLVLGAKRPLEKTKVFLERSGGKIRKLKFREEINRQDYEPLAKILSGHVGDIRSFTFLWPPREFVSELEGQFDSIQELVQEPTDFNRRFDTPPQPPDFGLKATRGTLRKIVNSNGESTFVPPDSRSILALPLTATSSATPDDEGEDDITEKSFKRPYIPEIANLTHFEKIKGHIYSPGGSLIPLAFNMPNLVTLVLHQVRVIGMFPIDIEGRIQLDQLVNLSLAHSRFHDHGGALREFFDRVEMPNLLHLDLCDVIFDLPSLCLSPGILPALQNLRSLDMGGSSPSQGQILDALKHMPQLQFLNVSQCLIGDTFLEAITKDHKSGRGQRKAEELLPNLIALSIAITDISSLALRDFAVSRLPKVGKPLLSQPAPSQAGGGSAFRPSSSRLSTPQSSIPVANVVSTSQVLSTKSITPAQKSSGPYLKWLCLDHCEKIDSQLVAYLRTKMPFVSFATNKAVEERMRGKGKYAWDLDYYDSCVMEEEKGKCRLEPIPGSRDGYEIKHVCGKYNHVEQVGPEKDNIWESQWNPSSSQSEIIADQEGSRGKGKEKEVEVEMNGGSQTQKRPNPSKGVSGRGKARKGKGKISIGPDGSLSGF